MANELKDQLEKLVDETTTETAGAPETNEEESTLVEVESKTTDDSVDEYKALLEEERAKRERAEKKILKLKEEVKSAPAIDKDALLEETRALIRQEMMAVREDEVKETLDSMLNSLATTPSERELIAHHYTNTIQKSGTSQSAIMQDLQRAKLIANEAKILKQNEELRGALKSKATMTTAPEFSGGNVRGEASVPMTSADKTLIARLGLKEDDIIKRLKQK